MAKKDKHAGPGKTLIFKHGEKMALGLTVALLAGYSAWGFVLQGEDESLANSDEAKQAMKRETSRYSNEHAVFSQAAEARRTPEEWMQLVKADPIYDMAGNYRTDVRIERLNKAADPTVGRPEKDWVVPDITLTTAAAELTGVTLDFELEEIVEVTTGLNQRLRADISDWSNWELQRKTLADDDAEWITLRFGEKEEDKQLEPGKFTLLQEEIGEGDDKKVIWRVQDPHIKPKTRYAYRLRAIGMSRTPTPTKYVGRYSNTKEVRTRGDFRWEIKGVWSSRDGRSQVQVFIYKFDRTLGHEVFIKLPHFEGDQIGGVEITDLPPTFNFTHKARDPKTDLPILDKNKRFVMVDFKTGATITKVEHVKSPTRWRFCTVEFSADGSPTCTKCEVKSEPYESNHVVIKDDEGYIQEWWTRKRIEKKDDLCSDHEHLRGKPFEDEKKPED